MDVFWSVLETGYLIDFFCIQEKPMEKWKAYQ